ncbi:MAG TPA: class I adenylate-forming enzyme family protein [Acidimicrobiales bacterium]|nr:class I adenylate-forming enzyme family protein [Acidimicrobiales bacterium]
MGERAAIRFRNAADPELALRFRREGFWGDVTVADLVARHATARPDHPAFVTPEGRLSWSGYRSASNLVAAALLEAGLEEGERVAVLLEDGAAVHVALVGAELAGLVAVGIGARAGELEIRHLVERTGAVALLSHRLHRNLPTGRVYDSLRHAGLPLRRHVVLPRFEQNGEGVLVDGQEVAPDLDGAATLVARRRIGPDDLFLINSTSGTTGLPKCVMHSQNSKMYMAAQARTVAALTADEVIYGAAPMPFGFGLFTAHFVPLVLGATAVVSSRFNAEQALELIERERATVLVCVSTQFKMLLNSPDMARRDLGSLRVMFTGGEMIPFAAAQEFEQRTGATVLNFYGSNESGMATGTRLGDPPDRRLRTGGTYLPGTEVRLFDDDRRDVTAAGRGQPGSRGPAACLGYYDDPAANGELFTEDGFVLHADICTLDADGYLAVVGRKVDIIIRGGKNLSAAAIEDNVSAHPAVALAAAVPIPDPLFGERVCAYVELRPGAELSLGELARFLDERGVSKEYFPEHLVVLDQIPRASGGKIAKGMLREDAARRAAEGAST